MASFYVENFGCRAARADGEAVSNRLRSEGLAEAGLADASVVVVNTCSVTAEADRDARAFVRKTRRLNPEAKVVVTGCYAQRAPEEIASLDGVAAVVGNSHKGLVPEIVKGILQGISGDETPSASQPLISPGDLLSGSSAAQVSMAQIWADDSFAHSYIEDAQVTPGVQTRPNLKIQEGCSNRCTFCVIPTTRGGSRSLSAEKVLAQIRGFVVAGGNELVLSGINLGRWGRDLPENRSLAGLLREILNETGLRRLRLSSIEPMDWTAELIELVREFGGSRIARHAHLPLQSGSDSVLRRMHRRYRPWHYEQKVAALLDAAGRELALGADVMVGFPGETEAEFRETFDFIANLPFAYLHLFPFSPRPGTRGLELHRQTPVASRAVTERMATLRALGDEKSRRFRAGFAGRSLPAITLQTPAQLAIQGRTSVLTDNYLPVEITEVQPANQLIDIRITGIGEQGTLLGTLENGFANRASAAD
ncbi:MAG TPA: tRNA (N(6)-L-threonylcarbamoyladenosine(37)-C(2))-methylthiotransferase MtaB [Acidobacteriaceae bacterium]|jgi:threonylcarbamoyladenosine tRNA methylthiotransferase MtaB|nr:tRNA (N(6)-L-threonylcarbamoyladenosine(37)-C(2))-methylthiotransferase MtaB [Acidobacteriaceae bacterium]